ncbi:glycosyltransferase family 2 protein [Vibrio sp. S11_S32]|uniref:glycosyltransferase family 2 protein n=1 Tax=Vibrio sp. S11_S32 TaxID=2720225 RepID=UPI00168179DB|nr:glycosyltransferase family 2 protein [Vibrio sp. S11_S32]MBD1577915.1 glycosyltransferase family 2 protein [Vibrio sp. S11_S32]
MVVDIVTPVFNAELYLKCTYRSIILQVSDDYSLKWQVTDDNSTDASFDMLSRFSCENLKINICRQRANSGAAASRNISISNATGDFIAFIDSDDLWLPGKLEKQVSFMELNNIDFSFTAYELIDEQGNPTGQNVDTHLTEPVSYEDMLRKKATLGCSTVMLRRSAFDDISMPLIRTGQDYALWLKLLRTGIKAYPIPEVLTQYRILSNSISRNKVKKAKRQWQIYRDIEKLPLFKSIECFCFYAWRAVFRK